MPLTQTAQTGHVERQAAKEKLLERDFQNLFGKLLQIRVSEGKPSSQMRAGLSEGTEGGRKHRGREHT